MKLVNLRQKARLTGIVLLTDPATGATHRFYLGDKLRAEFRMGPDDTDEHVRYIDGILQVIEGTQEFVPTGNIMLIPAKAYNQNGGVQDLPKYTLNIRLPELERCILLATKAQLEREHARELVVSHQQNAIMSPDAGPLR